MVLSATDLILVISVPTMFLVKRIREILGTPRCLYSICFSVVNETTPLLSATSLIIMNIERYLAFFHPIFHRTRATKGNILFTFIIIGCIFFTCAVINLAWHDIGRLIYSVGLLSYAAAAQHSPNIYIHFHYCKEGIVSPSY